jgi:hypothetical protein
MRITVRPCIGWRRRIAKVTRRPCDLRYIRLLSLTECRGNGGGLLDAPGGGGG